MNREKQQESEAKKQNIKTNLMKVGGNQHVNT
jgi:hypothetical protein